MSTLRYRLSFMLLLVGGAALLLLPATARAEKPPKQLEAKEALPVNRTGDVLWGGKWYASQILDEKEGKFFVHYNGYDDTFNEWVPKDRVRFPERAKAAAGPKKAEVFWGSTWWAASVLEEKEGQFQIKYDGYGDEWNEWVGKDRIRFAEPPAKAAAKTLKGAKCEVLWSTTWYPAEVVETKDGKFYIHYDNYGDNWNEWVGEDRIRFTKLKLTAPKDPRDNQNDEKQPNGQN